MAWYWNSYFGLTGHLKPFLIIMSIFSFTFLKIQLNILPPELKKVDFPETLDLTPKGIVNFLSALKIFSDFLLFIIACLSLICQYI